MGSESLKYFKLIKTMGDEIGVSSAIKPELLKRIEKNIGNSDSLAFITDDVYLSSFEGSVYFLLLKDLFIFLLF